MTRVIFKVTDKPKNPAKAATLNLLAIFSKEYPPKPILFSGSGKASF
jgi:hypothetical protein